MNLANWNRSFKELEDYFQGLQSNKWPVVGKDNSELTIPDWSPRVDIKETKEAYLIKAELPGIDKKDVNVTLEQGVLSIRGEKKYEQISDDEKNHRVECKYGSFVRSFSLPETVQEDKVTAKYKDGILHLTIPKSPAAKQKNIEIKID